MRLSSWSRLLCDWTSLSTRLSLSCSPPTSTNDALANHDAARDQRPNFLIILTDDQDDHMGSVEHMPNLNKYIINEGSYHPRHYCTIALCCPSRASLWTGLHGHNHNVTNVGGVYGGYHQVVKQGHNDANLFLWMQDLGYSTYYTGKLYNGMNADNYDKPPARGFNHSDLFVGGGVYNYYNVSHSIDGGPILHSNGYYSTDLVTDVVAGTGGHLDQAVNSGQPWMVVAAPVAPHVQLGKSKFAEPPEPALQYRDRFEEYLIPRTPDFNPITPGGASYYRLLPQLNDTVVEYNDELQRKRLRTLLSVDDMIEAIIRKLDAANQLENTYVIFTTDNGFHISQHRLICGKESGLETDIRIPFAIRGPGVTKGSINPAVTNHVDMSSTLLALAGANPREWQKLDGAVMPWTEELLQPEKGAAAREHTSVEFWGTTLDNGVGGIFTPFGQLGWHNNTYYSVRVIGEDYSFYYSVWCTNEHEVYDMKTDPYQLNNLYYDPAAMSEFRFQGRSFHQTMARLDALLLVLKTCRGKSCRKPWSALLPTQNVATLAETMGEQYDAFFARQPKVSYTECLLGHLISAEGPQRPNRQAWRLSSQEYMYEEGPLSEA